MPEQQSAPMAAPFPRCSSNKHPAAGRAVGSATPMRCSTDRDAGERRQSHPSKEVDRVAIWNILDCLPFRSRPIAAEDAGAEETTNSVAVMVDPGDVSNKTAVDDRYGSVSGDPSPAPSLSPSGSAYFTAADDSPGGGSSFTPPNKAGSDGAPPPRHPLSASADVEAGNQGQSSSSSDGNPAPWPWGVAALIAIVPEAKNIVQNWHVVPKSLFGITTAAALGLLATSAMSRGRLSSFSGRLGTVLSTSLLSIAVGCSFGGTVGCVAGGSAAGVLASVLTAIWAFEGRSAAVAEAISDCWGSLWRLQRKHVPADCPPA